MIGETSNIEHPTSNIERGGIEDDDDYERDSMVKATVLIVDDEKPTREGLRAALEDRFDVYVAEDAAAAMRLLEEEHFDVLLTDLRLPQEDGMKLIARAKSLPKPPVRLLSPFPASSVSSPSLPCMVSLPAPRVRLSLSVPRSSPKCSTLL